MDPQTSPVVLVTGASSGIGRACALHLGQRGYRVYGTSRRADPDMAVHAGAAAGASAGNAAFSMIQMDVDDGPSVERGIAHILRNEGGWTSSSTTPGLPWPGQ